MKLPSIRSKRVGEIFDFHKRIIGFVILLVNHNETTCMSTYHHGEPWGLSPSSIDYQSYNTFPTHSEATN